MAPLAPELAPSPRPKGEQPPKAAYASMKYIKYTYEIYETRIRPPSAARSPFGGGEGASSGAKGAVRKRLKFGLNGFNWNQVFEDNLKISLD